MAGLAIARRWLPSPALRRRAGFGCVDVGKSAIKVQLKLMRRRQSAAEADSTAVYRYCVEYYRQRRT
jgi:hypothetical protein